MGGSIAIRRLHREIRLCNRNRDCHSSSQASPEKASLLAVKPRVVSVTGAPVSYYLDKQRMEGGRERRERMGSLWKESWISIKG
ncbi:hypothetical protein TIFTF001_009725 [Ficus carica]|uniref:Uncharacterized protein n=1 Tax=Ficus carica TaxID=3494 RepID=A0AA88D2U9_FICCA|nr:hypothetical protein TIFTF001_009725 [Ficus carica]